MNTINSRSSRKKAVPAFGGRFKSACICGKKIHRSKVIANVNNWVHTETGKRECA